MTPLSLFIQGDPMGQPRALCRAVPIGKGKWRAMVYEPDHFKVEHPDPEQRRWARANVWKRTIRVAVERIMPQVPFGIPLRVDVEAVGPRPDAHYGTGRNADVLRADAPYFWLTTPDRDNIDKIILDSITETVRFWVGDQLVCDGRIIKRYQRTRAEPTGVRLRISAALAGASITDDPLVSKIPGLFQEGTAA